MQAALRLSVYTVHREPMELRLSGCSPFVEALCISKGPRDITLHIGRFDHNAVLCIEFLSQRITDAENRRPIDSKRSPAIYLADGYYCKSVRTSTESCVSSSFQVIANQLLVESKIAVQGMTLSIPTALCPLLISHARNQQTTQCRADIGYLSESHGQIW